MVQECLQDDHGMIGLEGSLWQELWWMGWSCVYRCPMSLWWFLPLPLPRCIRGHLWGQIVRAANLFHSNRAATVHQSDKMIILSFQASHSLLWTLTPWPWGQLRWAGHVTTSRKCASYRNVLPRGNMWWMLLCEREKEEVYCLFSVCVPLRYFETEK